MDSEAKSNRCIVMARRPVGEVAPEDWRLEQREMPQAGAGQVLVKVSYIDVQPAMRGWLAERPAYTPRIEEGEIMRAQGVGEVVESRDPVFAVGDWVHANLGVQQWAAVDATGCTRLDLGMGPPQRFLSALGSSGMTAYFGLYEVGQMAQSDTVVISSAAGAVGSVAGQIALQHGCRVVGIAGSEEKCRFLVDELGFHGAINYKLEDVYAGLAELCPDGIDLYFDNVGGPLLDLVVLQLAKRGRVVLSGMLSQYNGASPGDGLKFYGMLIVRHGRMEGFLAMDYVDRYPEARQRIAAWLQDGTVVPRELILDGVEAFPEAFPMLFDGRSFGKLLIRT